MRAVRPSGLVGVASRLRQLRSHCKDLLSADHEAEELRLSKNGHGGGGMLVDRQADNDDAAAATGGGRAAAVKSMIEELEVALTPEQE